MARIPRRRVAKVLIQNWHRQLDVVIRTVLPELCQVINRRIMCDALTKTHFTYIMRVQEIVRIIFDIICGIDNF